MGGTMFMGNFSDLASAMRITAQTTPTQLANLVTNTPVQLMVYGMCVFTTFMSFFIVCKFVVGACATELPFFNKLVGGDGGSDGVLGYIKSNGGNALLALVVASLGATGCIFSLTGSFIEAEPMIAQAASNIASYAQNTPEAVDRFKQIVNTTNNDNKLYEFYLTYVNDERSQEQSLAEYVKTYNPSSQDTVFLRKEADYTATVAKAQIISDRLKSDGYQNKANGVDLSAHIAKQTTDTDQEPAFNPSFILQSTCQQYRVNLQSRATN